MSKIEEFQIAVQAITTVGFPIACCLFCFWYINKWQAKNDERFDKLNEKITDALNNNTKALTTLTERLGNE